MISRVFQPPMCWVFGKHHFVNNFFNPLIVSQRYLAVIDSTVRIKVTFLLKRNYTAVLSDVSCLVNWFETEPSNVKKMVC